MAGLPHGISSRATYGRSISPGVIGSTVLPQRYDAKSEPGSSSTRVPSSRRVEVLRGVVPVLRDVLGALEVLAVEGPVDERREVHEQQDDHDRDAAGREHRARVRAAAPRTRRSTPTPSSTASREHDERHRARGAAHREPDTSSRSRTP